MVERTKNRKRKIAAESASSEDGAIKPRTLAIQYKLLIFIIYGDGLLSYVKRDRHVFNVWRRPICIKYRRTVSQVNELFRKLENEGYIYNLDVVGPDVRFCFNPPSWLTFSEMEKKTRAKVPIGNPAHTGNIDKLSAWGSVK